MSSGSPREGHVYDGDGHSPIVITINLKLKCEIRERRECGIELNSNQI